jgi:hypothetical protein
MAQEVKKKASVDRTSTCCGSLQLAVAQCSEHVPRICCSASGW